MKHVAKKALEILWSEMIEKALVANELISRSLGMEQLHQLSSFFQSGIDAGHFMRQWLTVSFSLLQKGHNTFSTGTPLLTKFTKVGSRSKAALQTQTFTLIGDQQFQI